MTRATDSEWWAVIACRQATACILNYVEEMEAREATSSSVPMAGYMRDLAVELDIRADVMRRRLLERANEPVAS